MKCDFIKKIFIDRYGNNKLKEILRSRLFWIGLVVKIVLACTLASGVLTDLFIPFINYYVDSGFKNPYQHFLNMGVANAFPYPSLMLYIMSVPRIVFGFFVNWDIVSWGSIFLIRAPIFVADFLILITMTALIKKENQKILVYYWLSPVLIYINYVHGQLDVIPIAIFFISLYLLFKRKFEYSSILFGLAVAAKTHMFIAFPFYFVYLLYCKDFGIRRLICNCVLVLVVFIAVNAQYLLHIDFIEMVLNNKEQVKIFDFGYTFSNGNVLYCALFAYLFLFISAIDLKGFGKDVYIMFLGFSFGIFTLMVAPMQGWYYWVIPFFIYFHCKRIGKKYDFTMILFFLLQVAYFVYFLFIKDSDYLQVLQTLAPNLSEINNVYTVLHNKGMDGDKIVNIAFTFLQAMLLVNCIFIYRSGVRSYANYKIFSHPFFLGICGDSGSGKTTIANAIKSIFKNRNTTVIHGDDMHKWERGNDHWKDVTHLNPKSNLLYNDISCLKAIKNNEVISRRSYDHDSGTFTEVKHFRSNNLVIFEGLHSLYIKQMRDLYDLRIFVNPSELLRKMWKINRDTKKRGHSEKNIVKQMDSRQKDAKKFINAQIKYADIIVEIIKDENLNKSVDEGIYLRMTAINSFYLEPLFDELSAIDTLCVTHEYEDDDKQFLEIHGRASVKDIDGVAFNLLINKELENLGVNNPLWDDNYLGIIQVFVAYYIVNNLTT